MSTPLDELDVLPKELEELEEERPSELDELEEERPNELDELLPRELTEVIPSELEEDEFDDWLDHVLLDSPILDQVLLDKAKLDELEVLVTPRLDELEALDKARLDELEVLVKTRLDKLETLVVDRLEMEVLLSELVVAVWELDSNSSATLSTTYSISQFIALATPTTYWLASVHEVTVCGAPFLSILRSLLFTDGGLS